MVLNKRNLLVLCASFVSFGYLFSNFLGSISFIFLVLAFLINYKDLNFSAQRIFSTPSFSLILFFLFVLICSVYSLNPNQAQKEIVRFLSFLIYPIIFSSIVPFDKKERRKIILFFISSLLVFFGICFVVSIQRQLEFWSIGGSFNWYFFYRYDFLEVLNQHPTYVSMFTLLGLSFLNFLPEKQVIFKKRIISGFLSIVLIFALILYGSRVGYILLLILQVVYLIKLIKFKRSRELIFVLISCVLVLVVSWNIPIVKERILFSLGESYNYKYNDKEGLKIGTEEHGRLLMWQDAIELIKERPLLGYGAGASRQVLLEKYEEKGHYIFLEGRYNAHNTYLELLLWGGVLILFFYFIYLGLLFYQSIIKRDLLLLSFFLILSISSITETIFIAQGIMFAAFFYCFLNQKYHKNEID